MRSVTKCCQSSASISWVLIPIIPWRQLPTRSTSRWWCFVPNIYILISVLSVLVRHCCMRTLGLSTYFPAPTEKKATSTDLPCVRRQKKEKMINDLLMCRKIEYVNDDQRSIQFVRREKAVTIILLLHWC